MIKSESKGKGNQGNLLGQGESEECWTSNLLVLKECGLISKKAVISLTPRVHIVIQALNEKFRGKEWLGYLAGTVDVEEMTACVDDLYIPKQEVTAASVDVLEVPEAGDIIGTVHTHGGGVAGNFSGTDAKYIIANHSVSILAGKDSYTGKLRIKAPCCHFILIEATVIVKLPQPSDLAKILKQAESKISQKVYKYQHPEWEGGYPRYPLDMMGAPYLDAW